jgi:GTP-binding protein LepA
MKNIRNFCIISHIDHGKSTLADRFLEITKTVEERDMKEQFLDKMNLEREKGITIKLKPVRMNYILDNISYTLNLIDTPGHVDFSYEVSRSLAAVEVAILLVDATKGIQAQTLANLDLARKQNLVIIPAVNKIDSPQAEIEKTIQEIINILNIEKRDIFLISGKNGTNVEQLLRAIIEKAPPQKGENKEKPLKALIFDSQYDFYKGVIAFVRIFDGEIKEGQNIYLIQGKTKSEAKEVGIFKPELISTKKLEVGEIGYIATGIKEPEKIRAGDTITNLNFDIEPLPGYQEPKPVVFASFYPEDPDQFEILRNSLAKLKLNDASLFFEPETKDFLGRGFRCGFLGSLHAEIVSERLSREFNLKLIISSPSVFYKIVDEEEGKENKPSSSPLAIARGKKEFFISSAQDWPEKKNLIIEEPWVKLEVITPQSFLSSISDLLKKSGGNYIENKYFSPDRLLLIYEIPFREIVTGFYDKLKSQSQGFASVNYRNIGYRRADLVKLDILIAGKKQEAFSKIVSSQEVYQQGKKMVEKLKEILPPQLFSVPLQAVVSGKIIARETLSSRGKDVIAGLYGGDYTRKRKLLEKQKRGKKALREKGKVNIPQTVFLKMFQV